MTPEEWAGCLFLILGMVGLCLVGAALGGLVYAMRDSWQLIIGSAGVAFGGVGLFITIWEHRRSSKIDRERHS